MHAMYREHGNVVALLLAREIRDQSSTGHKIRLLRAVEKGKTQILHELIADMQMPSIPSDLTDPKGQTALAYAAKIGHREMVSVLIKLNASDISSQNSQGLTPLMYAASNGHAAAVELLVPHSHVNVGDSESGSTALMLATEYCKVAPSKSIRGYHDTVHVLLASPHVMINLQMFCGCTALMTAVQCADSTGQRLVELPGEATLPIVEMLLERPELDISHTCNGNNVLHLACRSSNVGAVKLLLGHAAAPALLQQENRDGLTALALARTCDKPNTDLIQLLLDGMTFELDTDFAETYDSPTASNHSTQDHEDDLVQTEAGRMKMT